MGRLRLLVVACVLLWSPQLWAASIRPYIEQAASLYRKGNAESKQGRHAQAVEFYKEAVRWVRKAFPLAKKNAQQTQKLKRSEGTLMFIIARSYLASRKCRLASYYARLALRAPIPKRTRLLAREGLRKARALPLCQPGSLSLQTTPKRNHFVLKGASKWLRGLQRKGQTPGTLRLLPGKWILLIQRGGFRFYGAALLIRPNQATIRRVVLKPYINRPRGVSDPPIWPRWLLFGAGIATLGAGVGVMGWAGSTFAEVSSQQGRPIEGVAAADTYSFLKAKADAGSAGMAAGIAMTSIGLAGVGVAAWWLLRRHFRPIAAGPVVTPAWRRGSR